MDPTRRTLSPKEFARVWVMFLLNKMDHESCFLTDNRLPWPCLQLVPARPARHPSLAGLTTDSPATTYSVRIRNFFGEIIVDDRKCLAIIDIYLSLAGESQTQAWWLRLSWCSSIDVVKCLVITDLYNCTTLILLPTTTTTTAAQTNINTDWLLIINTSDEMETNYFFYLWNYQVIS